MLLATQLKQRYGAEVTVLGLMAQRPGRVTRRCEDAGIIWQPLPFFWHDGARARVNSLCRLTQALRRLKAEIILPYTFLPNVACSLVWRFTGARLCLWNQRDEGRCLDNSWWHKAALRSAPCLVSNSGVGKDFLEREFALGKKPVQVIPNALVRREPLLDRAAWRSALSLTPERFVAAMVANLHGYKDHVTLLRAWRVFLDRCTENGDRPVLLLAGRFDGAQSELLDLAATLAMEDEVRLLGEVADVSTLLSGVDLYLHSSRYEGVPNAVLEAMSMALPVVATYIPGIEEAVGPRGAKYLAGVGDYRQMAHLIEIFYADAALRREIGENLKRHVLEKHNLDIMIDASVAIMSHYLQK